MENNIIENSIIDNNGFNNAYKEDDYKSEFILFKTVSIVEKYNFYEYISVMIDGGVSIVESLKTVESKITSIYFKKRIKELITFITSGDSFSKSMKKIPDIFTSSEISIIEAGESSGTLSSSLLKLSDDLKKVHDLRNKVKGSLTYPIIIFLFLFLALFIVLTFVVPQIKPLFDTAEVELPLSTKLLIGTSDFIIGNIWLLFLILISIVVFFFGYKNTESGKRSIDEFLFGLPLVGKVYRNYILSNIASTLGSLVGSGVSIIKTLKLIGKSTNSTVYESLFEDIVVRVSGGEKIVRSMEAVDPNRIYFPADYTQMLSVGERTANLESISKKINAQYTKEVDYSLANLTKWIEPLAILLASVFVLWFAYAILGAILKITQTVG
ncbi:MAG: type II secretion system F family protein [Candidatus Gracilibacteria bacterium]|nr:type II secretion system F family protein [Candidatus Gracilibacteria bacterium]